VVQSENVTESCVDLLEPDAEGDEEGVGDAHLEGKIHRVGPEFGPTVRL
jgi:hypothetical protein